MVFQTYKDLEIYRLSHELAIEIHKVSLSLPKFEFYEEGSQVRRAAKSIPANIAEGFGRRRYKNEFIRFLTFALASCDETKEPLEILSAEERNDKRAGGG
jgi:four helix bundle protein